MKVQLSLQSYTCSLNTWVTAALHTKELVDLRDNQECEHFWTLWKPMGESIIYINIRTLHQLKLYYILYTYTYNTRIHICNTFTPQIKGICCGLNVMYHIPQLSRCATTFLVCYNFLWNVLQLPIRMQIIMLQLSMAFCKNTRAL